MLVAARTLALSAVDLLQDAEIVGAAKTLSANRNPTSRPHKTMARPTQNPTSLTNAAASAAPTRGPATGTGA